MAVISLFRDTNGYEKQWQWIEQRQVEHSISSKCSAKDRRERNRLRNEGKNLNISGDEEIENYFKSELRSLKGLEAL